MRRFPTLALCCFVVFGCAPDPSERSTRQEPDPTNAPESAFRNRLLEIAASYKSYQRVDDSVRWGPEMCRDIGLDQELERADEVDREVIIDVEAPVVETPVVEAPAKEQAKRDSTKVQFDIFLSKSDDRKTHGRKLYFLYAAFVDELSGSYAVPTKDQVVVKESWIPEHCPTPPKNGEVNHVATGKDGKLYRAKEKGPLFVMFQVDRSVPGTDEGWVYGTLTPDGKTVTGVGRLENCMECHRNAPHGRLFGLPKK